MAGSFWADVSIEPKRQYRWLAYIGGIQPFVLKKISKPKVVVGETEHKFLNHSFFYPGRAVWDTVQMVMADPADPDMASTMMGFLLAAGYKSPVNQSEAVSTISKSRGDLGSVRIVQLGANASNTLSSDVIEEWTLVNAWIKDIAWGELSYDSEDMVDITVTLRYDYATITPNPILAHSATSGLRAPGPSQRPNHGSTTSP